MFGMYIFTGPVENEPMLYVLTIAFIFGFEFGPGPIVWLYLSEICNDQATSVNTVANWAWTLVISISTLPLNNSLGGGVWLLFGCCNVVGFIYIVLVMKETKGVSKE